EVDQGGGTVNEDGISLYSSQTRVELSNEDFNDPKREIKDGLKEEKNKNEILNKLKTLESNLSKEKEIKEQLKQNHTKAKQEFDLKLKRLENEVKKYKQRYEGKNEIWSKNPLKRKNNWNKII
ncbi:10807_t:CDS:1, partial [Funneliformis geosporum]